MIEFLRIQSNLSLIPKSNFYNISYNQRHFAQEKFVGGKFALIFIFPLNFVCFADNCFQNIIGNSLELIL